MREPAPPQWCDLLPGTRTPLQAHKGLVLPVVDVRRRAGPGLCSDLEECVGAAGPLAWDHIGDEDAHYPQRFYALAWQDVSDSLPHLCLSHSAGFVAVCNIYCVAHKESPFSVLLDHCALVSRHGESEVVGLLLPRWGVDAPDHPCPTYHLSTAR